MHSYSEEHLEKMLEHAYVSRLTNIKDSFKDLKSILEISRFSQLENIEAKAHSYLGLLFMITGDHEKAINHSNNALGHFQKVNNLKAIADAKFNISSSLYKTDNFHDGLNGLLECQQMYRSIGDTKSEAKALKSIATIYEFWGDLEKAFIIYLECIELSEKNKDLGMLSNVYNPLSGLYIKRGKIGKAYDISVKSIKIKKKINDERGLAFSIYGKGKVYLVLGKYALAKKYFLESLELQKKFGDKLGEGMVLNKLGVTYINSKDYINAEKTLLIALRFSKKYNIKLIQYKVCNNLFQLYKKQGDSEKALKYLELYVKHKENTINSRTTDIIKSYEIANEIYRLEQDTKVQKGYLDVVQKKNAELDEFFYRISHDLKGPITSLMGLNSLLKQENFDKKTMEYLCMYQKQSTRIHNIVMDLINITKMKSDEIVPSNIDFGKLIDDCIHSYLYFENFEKIEFRIHIGEGIEFKSEWVIINTILQNLIENSIKYIREDVKPYIAIKVYSLTTGNLNIEVEDNGQGIPKEYQDKIYDMFYRANEKADGSGLGLYILKKAVERLQGEVTLKSDLGRGSLFTVLLKDPLFKVQQS
jgi:signal transduction histidine kinase